MTRWTAAVALAACIRLDGAGATATPSSLAAADAWEHTWGAIALVGGLLLLAGMMIVRTRLFRARPNPRSTSDRLVEGKLNARLAWAARSFGLAATAFGAIALIGWAAGISRLSVLVPGYAPILPITAIGVVFLGIAACLDRPHEAAPLGRFVAAICCLGALAIGAERVVELATGANLSAGQSFVSGSTLAFSSPGQPAVRMDLASTLNLLLLGSAFLFRFLRRFERAATPLIVVAAVNCLLHAMWLVYGARHFEAFPNAAMALPSLCAFTFLCVAAVIARPDLGAMKILVSPGPGGVLARRLFPAAVVIPAALGWLRWQGELNGAYGTVFGLVLHSSSLIVVFTLVTFLSAVLLNRMDSVRSAAERDLRESQRLLLQLADAMPQIVWTASTTGQKDYFNRCWFEFTGLEIGPSLDRTFRSAVHPGDLERLEQAWKLALATGKGFTAEVRLRHVSGDFRWQLKRVVPVLEGSGKVVRWIGTCTDVEDYKRIEEASQRMNRDLEDHISKLMGMELALRLNNKELAEQTTRAETANHAKDQFLATMSHEIRTPMNAILGISELLSETSLDAEQSNYIDICRRAGSALMSLIDDMLDISKVEGGHLQLEKIEFELEEVLDQALELTAPKARAKKLTLALHSRPGLPPFVVGDAGRLRQILLNLLGNAVKFTSVGEIVLTVTNTGHPGSGAVGFAVSDTGIGIPADKLTAIFEDFSQADSSTTRNYGGTGLGLAISRRLVELMGGRLTVESMPGRGSTFRFNLKFDVPAGSRAVPLSPRQELQGSTVLVLDDNLTNRLILLEILSSWGMTCVDFARPGEALVSLQARVSSGTDYDLALIDCHMHEMNGFDVAKCMHSLAPRTPIVMLTSDPQVCDNAGRVNAGLAGYALRPLRNSQLFRLLCDAMGRPAATAKAPNVPNAPENPVAATPQRIRPLRILIAEDMPDNQLLVRAYMKGSPHDIVFVGDGSEAIDAFRNGAFDLVLMDLLMPRIDGLSATRTIRCIEQENRLPATPIVAFSANASAADIKRSLQAGCQSHLSKPISKSRLLAAIAEYGGTQPISILATGGATEINR